MENLTRKERTLTKCCILAEIRLQEEDLKNYTNGSIHDEENREAIERNIKELRTIIQKLEG